MKWHSDMWRVTRVSEYLLRVIEYTHTHSVTTSVYVFWWQLLDPGASVLSWTMRWWDMDVLHLTRKLSSTGQRAWHGKRTMCMQAHGNQAFTHHKHSVHAVRWTRSPERTDLLHFNELFQKKQHVYRAERHTQCPVALGLR